MAVGTFGMMAGVFFSSFFKKYFDRKNVAIFLSFASVVLGGSFYWLPQNNFILLCTMNFLWPVIAGAIPVFIFSMFAYVADFYEWKFKQRATGLVTAGIMFAIKMGVAIGGFLALFLPGLFGYEKQVPIAPEVANGIKLLSSIIPAFFILI